MSNPNDSIQDLQIVLIAQANQIDDLIVEQERQFKEIDLLLNTVYQLAGVVREMCKNHPDYTDASKRPEVECEFCEKQHDDYIEHVQIVAEKVKDAETSNS